MLLSRDLSEGIEALLLCPGPPIENLNWGVGAERKSAIGSVGWAKPELASALRPRVTLAAAVVGLEAGSELSWMDMIWSGVGGGAGSR